jgi:hypothetical protein
MRSAVQRGQKNGAIARGLAALRDADGDITPGHLVACGLTRRQADNAIGYAMRLRVVRRVARGVYRRASSTRAA